MKKLSLKNLKLEASDMLERNQLKTVYGGYYSNQILDICESNCSSLNPCWSGEVCAEFMSDCNGQLISLWGCGNA